ncbi:uncharacterized protein LOC143449276 [Clavelina lepadiformis]|uniref:Protein polyglycylase TTLL10 n=1 Tax=Clavelina lepadiformis TaxID=159417 RepID=A0ABP0H2G0_CLALP
METEDIKEIPEKSVLPEKEKKSISYDEEEEEDVDENEAPNVVSHSRRRYSRKPKAFFYIGGNNGTHMVEENLTTLGWERIHDKNREDFKLKWCEIKAHNNYHCFREGEQLCYQIPNNKLLTTKIGLLTSLREYDRVMNKVKKGKPKIMRYQDFLPESYRLDVKDEREMFFDNYVDGEIWISKPTGLNQGKGIYLIRSQEDIVKIQEKIADVEEDVQNSRKLPFKIPMARIVQRYVTNPLLLEGRKFDVRNYFLIACTNPLVVFYRDGYCRLTCMPYDHYSTDLTGHLTNQFMQKKSPLYEELKEDTVWSMDRFNDYVNENFQEKYELPEDWVHIVLKRRCQQIILHCFQAVRHKLECRLGFFDLIGCDFLVDDNFKISLLEMNCNPALHTNCEVLREVMPDLVSETLKISLEIFEKANKRERIMPLTSQRNFALLYNGDIIEAAERRERLQSAAEARRRARSAQRRKRFVPGQFVYRRSLTNCQTSTTSSSTTTTANNATSSNSQPSPSTWNSVSSSATSTSNSSPVVTSTMPYRPLNLPSSTVTALTSSSQQRVVQSKSTPNVSLKPFYAGGSVSTTRPYSAPRVNRKYAQVESRISTNSNIRPAENFKRENEQQQNNTGNMSISKPVSYAQKARSVSLAPRRNEIMENEQILNELDASVIEDGVGGDLRDQLGVLERDNLFDQILEEDEKVDVGETDMEDDEDELLLLSESESPELIRRPSAKLPPNYHSRSVNGSISLANGISTSPRFSQLNQATMRKKVSRIASFSVRGSSELPLPSVGVAHSSPRPALDHAQRVHYRAPTTVRVRQSLQATTCTLDIGPKSRRGLVAVSMGGRLIPPGANDKPNAINRKLNSLTRLKLINGNQKHIDDEIGDVPSALLYLSNTHVQAQCGNADQETRKTITGGAFPAGGCGMVSIQARHHQQAPLAQMLKTLQNQGKSQLSDSFTQTTRSKISYGGEEKVIWRLRSRVTENSQKVVSDGSVSPTSQRDASKSQKVTLKVPVVTQSPGIVSPRRLVEPIKRNANVHKKSSLPAAGKSKTRNNNGDVKEFSNISQDTSEETSSGMEHITSTAEKPSALSKVVAVATAAPTHSRSQNESKPKLSSSFEEPHLLTAG